MCRPVAHDRTVPPLPRAVQDAIAVPRQHVNVADPLGAVDFGALLEGDVIPLGPMGAQNIYKGGRRCGKP